MGKYCCDWCGCTHEECECSQDATYGERALARILDIFENSPGERRLPRLETVRRTGAARGTAL
jgi:hypothetical protein